MAAKMLARLVRACPFRWARAGHVYTTASTAPASARPSVAVYRRWVAALRSNPLTAATFVTGGLAATVGSAECAGGDGAHEVSNAGMDTPAPWTTNPLRKAEGVRFSASSTSYATVSTDRLRCDPFPLYYNSAPFKPPVHFTSQSHVILLSPQAVRGAFPRALRVHPPARQGENPVVPRLWRYVPSSSSSSM